MRVRGNRAMATLAVLALFASACSFSKSSESSSDSSAASSRSLSSSSPDGKSKNEQAYRQDVGDYTASWARSKGDPGDGAEFQKGLARIAERHGVTNWEADRATYLGIGQGLRSAGVAPDDVSAFQSSLGGDSGSGAKLIEEGYADVRS